MAERIWKQFPDQISVGAQDLLFPDYRRGAGGKGVFLSTRLSPAGLCFSSVAVPPPGFQPITLTIHEKVKENSIWFDLLHFAAPGAGGCSPGS